MSDITSENIEILKDYTKEEIDEKVALAEAILFAIGNSVSIDRLSEALELEKKQVRALISILKEEYENSRRGIELVELDNSVQLGTKTMAYDVLAKIGKASPKYTLTDTVLETLSIVAYKQPVTRAQIEKIRGVACDHAINKLVEYELIEEVGRLDAPGKPLLFATTEQFLRAFGVKSIADLPQASAELIADFKLQAEAEAFNDIDDAFGNAESSDYSSYNDVAINNYNNDSDGDSDNDSDDDSNNENINVEV